MDPNRPINSMHALDYNLPLKEVENLNKQIKKSNEELELEHVAIQPQASSRITRVWEKIKLGIGDLTGGIKRLGKWVFSPFYRLAEKIYQVAMKVSATVETTNSPEIYEFTAKPGYILRATEYLIFEFPENRNMEDSEKVSYIFKQIDEIGFTTLEETLRHLRPTGSFTEKVTFYLCLSEFDYNPVTKTSSPDPTKRSNNVPLISSYIKELLYSALGTLLATLKENSQEAIEAGKKIDNIVKWINTEITNNNEIDFGVLQDQIKDVFLFIGIKRL